MHVHPLVIVDAQDAGQAKEMAEAWIEELLASKAADGADYGEVAEGLLSETVVQAGTDRFRAWVREAALGEREQAAHAWSHLKALTSTYADRTEPPGLRDAYTVEGMKWSCLMGLRHACKLHGYLLHQRDRKAFSTLVRIYDQRKDQGVHLLELPSGTNVYAVLCDFHE